MTTEEKLEEHLGQLVTVVLESGPRLTGTLQRSKVTIGLLEFEVLSADSVHQGFQWNDVQEVIPLHPAEAAAEEQMCTCQHSDDLAADFESQHNCPVHQFDMSDAAQYRAYRAWRANVFASIRAMVPADDAGAWLGVDCDYSNVVFQISAAGKPEGDSGEIIVQVDLAGSAVPAPKRRAFVECNWRTDSEADVAKKAVEAYAKLLHPTR